MLTKSDRKRARRKSIINREFLIAVIDEDFDKVKRLISGNVNVNYADRDDCTALHLATESGNSELLKLLVNKGAILDVKNIDGETPLDIATRLNNSKIIHFLTGLDDHSIPSESFQNEFCENKLGVWVNPVHGNIYQLKVLMLFLFRGVKCQYSFRLGTEIREARKFDDLVFEYTNNGKKVYRLLQAKHKIDESKKITVDSLLADTNGDYSLVKYLVSYQVSKKENYFKNGTIKDVTICTNIDFDYKNLKEARVQIKKIVEKDNILDVESEGKEPARYKFTKKLTPQLKNRLQISKLGLKYTISDDDINDFLQHLVFAVNQPNEAELGNIVKNEISKELDFLTTENVYNKLFIQMLDWMKSKDRSTFWSYKDGKNLFEEIKKGMPIWYNVQDPVKSFTGRAEELKNIHEAMQIGKKEIVCVSGLGGVGKSELVKKYVAEYSQSYDNKVVWINAESHQTLSDSFRELACEKLGITSKNADGKEKDLSVLVSETYQYFCDSKSLFVFDNAEMYKSKTPFDAGINKFLPRLPKNLHKPHILLTSRNQKWPENVKVQVLEAFTETEAESFITQSLQLENEEQNRYVVELGKKLQLLPLALQQAVAYIRAQNDKLANIGSGFQISDYFAKLMESNEEILNFEFSSDSDNTYTHTVFTTWNVTLDAIQKKKNGKDALDILNIASYFLPDNIPMDLLSLVKPNKDRLASAIEILKQYSLINVQNKTFSLHRLVQQITRIKLDEKEEKKVLEVILKETNEAHVNVKNIDHFISLWSYSMKHIELVVHYYDVAKIITKVLSFCYRFHEAKTLIAEVTRILDELSENNKKAKIGKLSLQTASANIYLNEGEYKKALQLFLQTYELKKSVHGLNGRETLKEKLNVAHVLQKLNRSDEALEWCREVLKAERVVLGESDPDTLSTKIQMATILIQRENYDEALSVLEPTYDAYKKILGDNDGATMKTRSAIAEIYTRQERYDEALKILEVIYNSKKEVLGVNHPDTLSQRLLIADIFSNQPDKYTLALEIYEEVLKVKQKFIGEHHPEVLQLQVNIGDTLHRSGQTEKSLEILQDALKKQIAIFGPFNLNVYCSKRVIASLLCELGKDFEALNLLEELLNYNIGDEGVVDRKEYIHQNILDICMRLNETDKALEHSIKIAKLHEKTLGNDNLKTLDAKAYVGLLYYQKKDYKKAFEILMQVKSMRETTSRTKDQGYVDLCRVLNRILNENMTPDALFESFTPKDAFDAVRHGNLDTLKIFLAKGTDPNMQDQHGRTLLHIAASGDNVKIVEYLIKNGADVTRVTEKGNTVLHIAALKNNQEIARAISNISSRVELDQIINAKTKSTNKTALHVASEKGYYQMARLFFTLRAAYDARDISNKSPLDLTKDMLIRELLKRINVNFELVKSGREESDEYFLQYHPTDFLLLNVARNVDGYNLIQLAIVKNRKFLVQQLIRLKRNILIDLPIFSTIHWKELLPLATTALMKLRKDSKLTNKNTLESVRQLVDTFRIHDKEIQNQDILGIEDMLQLLESHEHVESLLELSSHVIENHVNLFVIWICTQKLVEVSKRNDWTQVIEYVKQGANVNFENVGGWRPLHYAVNSGNEAIVELLLEHSAEVYCVTRTGKNTPLHIAVKKGHMNIVSMLLKKNRSLNFINARTEAKGSTAMHIAAKSGRMDIVMMLMWHGATYCLKNKEEKMPKDLVENLVDKALFEVIDELFDDVTHGSFEVLGKINELRFYTFLAIISTSNDEEYNLAAMAQVKGHEQLASKILSLTDERKKAYKNEKLG